jgi:hypothetical protein
VAVDPLTPTTLYAGTSAGVFTSTDAGETWSPTGLIQHSPLVSLSFEPASVTAGSPSTGVVTFNRPAPAGGAVVALRSHNTALATVPASVTVPAGATSATFPVSTSVVSFTTLVLIQASLDGAVRQAQLQLTAAPQPTPTPTPSPAAAVAFGPGAPAAGATLKGTVPGWEATVSGLPAGVTVSKVEFRWLGSLFQTERGAPYCVAGNPSGAPCAAWNTALRADGTGPLELAATLSSGQVLRASRTLTIDNVP